MFPKESLRNAQMCAAQFSIQKAAVNVLTAEKSVDENRLVEGIIKCEAVNVL